MNENKEQPIKEEPELTKEDMEIQKLKAKIDGLKKAKKARIAKEKVALRKKREHYLITLGADVQAMLNIKEIISDADVKRTKHKIQELLSIQKTINDRGIYTNKQIIDVLNRLGGKNNG